MRTTSLLIVCTRNFITHTIIIAKVVLDAQVFQHIADFVFKNYFLKVATIVLRLRPNHRSYRGPRLAGISGITGSSDVTGEYSL